MELTKELIAPCGINCGTCYAYIRKKNNCTGCLKPGNTKTHCISCRIKTCENHKDTPYCSDCEKFPCYLIKNIDKRYQKNYNLSLIENLKTIKDIGIDDYIKNENIKWTCACGERLSIHSNTCKACGKKYK